ncbi:tRNA (N(6)-L-threonylcarbamoyladenosine(37)-C(2))-methylthiotransferase [Methanobacterium paludis]|uniref:tRNA-t(6)A37 methylthiotransferase n=1 Tax=Methanobacterium paludis (strain DSM 25820 / JCM 18151 / SWAN1) TaxID=868131 RepID=F6D6K1_METPW|nr:tRNA (N(6)-L-threonylcarbamoyladenosine(37)-C(2))-methylthiotransferase [Methanobacterium paludis]AEG17714.1 RNA modification enzyme, MiaB family [Methanobacterium paludis]
MNIYIETFGCTFNQADSQIMAGLLKENQEKIVSKPEDADVIIINTCYVKHPTEQKAINRIHKVQKQFPDKKLIISGCMVEIDKKKLQKAAPNASWIGPHKVTSTPEIVKSVFNGENVRSIGYGTDCKVCLPKIRSNPFIHIVQICEGCNGDCSYCCTRFARGSLQSYPTELIKREVEEAVAEGCVEIQITAQDTAAYGKDTGTSLSKLINEITTIEGDFKIRVGMMHPKSIMDDVDGIIKAFKNEKVYKFLHIPIQSGNDDVLRDMNRGHTVADFKDVVSKFKENIPEMSISTDVIVGYPTEDEDAFKDTLNLVADIRPDFINISKYGHRPGTRSSLMEEISHESMKKRSKSLNDLKTAISYENNLKMLGSTQNVVITGKGSKGGYISRANSYKQVIVENAVIGSFSEAKIIDAKSTYLMGNLIH